MAEMHTVSLFAAIEPSNGRLREAVPRLLSPRAYLLTVVVDWSAAGQFSV